jgi:hypothetical protein
MAMEATLVTPGMQPPIDFQKGCFHRLDGKGNAVNNRSQHNT